MQLVGAVVEALEDEVRPIVILDPGFRHLATDVHAGNAAVDGDAVHSRNRGIHVTEADLEPAGLRRGVVGENKGGRYLGKVTHGTGLRPGHRRECNDHEKTGQDR